MDRFLYNGSTRYVEGLEPVHCYRGSFHLAGAQVVPPTDYGPEAVPSEYPYQIQDPQIVVRTEGKEAYNQEEAIDVALPSNSDPRRHTARRWWIAAICAVVAVVMVILGLVLGLRHKESRSTLSNTPITPPANNSTVNTSNLTVTDLSTVGAFNGTGLSMIPPYNVRDQIYLFYQHYSGDLRYSELTDSGWQGGGSAEIAVSSSVKNGTPIAGCSGEPGDVIFSYLFYVDTSGTVQEVYQGNNSTGSWSAGNFGSLKFRASDSHHAAFTSCWDPEWYGSNPGNSSGMRFYAGGVDGLIHEFTWDSASNVWGIGYTFPNSNGNAGAKCWPGSSVSYLYMQNSNYELELWWKDYDTSQTNSSTHPRGVWNQGPVAAGIDIQPNSSLAMSYYAYFQDSNNQIVGIFPNASSEDSSWGASFIVGDGTALPGTSIECQTFYPSNDSPSGIYVFFQTNGTDIMEYVRPQFGGAWSTNSVPVA